MFLFLNPNSGIPLYRQMLQQLRERIASGQLKPGEKLLSARDLAQELKVNFLTVAKAYQYLEREELVEVRRGLGTFVREGKVKRSLSEKRKLILPSVEQLLAEARHLELEEKALQELVREQFKKKLPSWIH